MTTPAVKPDADRQRAIKALLDKWQTREYGQHAGYLAADEIVDIVIDAALAAEPPAEPQEKQGEPALTEFCWLVELFEPGGNSMGHYHTGFADLAWRSRSTKDPYMARRYNSKEEAERAASGLFDTAGVWRAIEHGFAATQAEPSARDRGGQAVSYDTAGFIRDVLRITQGDAELTDDEALQIIEAALKASGLVERMTLLEHRVERLVTKVERLVTLLDALKTKMKGDQ